MRHYVLAITGASGACYARKVAACLVESQTKVHLIVSPAGRKLLAMELDVAEPRLLLGAAHEHLAVHAYDDLADKLASGSVHTDGMMICPCSVNTTAAIANGLCDNLIARAAHVHLKTGRKLVLVPRETPTTAIDLGNQARLAQCGATIAPACPAFYTGATTVDDLIDFLAARLLEALGVPHGLNHRYGNLDE